MVTVEDNPDGRRFELMLDGRRVGQLTYRVDADVITLVHTEVDPEVGGRGLGTTLVVEALDRIRDTGLLVVPQCPFVRFVIDRAPEYKDLVKES